MDNANSPEYLNKIKNSVIENLSRTRFAPSTQMTEVPPDIIGMDDDADAALDDLDEDENMDARHTQRRWDKYVEKDGELSESEDEEENKRNGVLRQPGAKRRRNIMDYQNPDAVPDDPRMTGLNGNLTSQITSSAEAEPASNGAVINVDAGIVDQDTEMGEDRSDDVIEAEGEYEPALKPKDESEQQPGATGVESPSAKAATRGETDTRPSRAEEGTAAKEEASDERMEHDTNAEAATETAREVDENQ